MLSHTFLSPHAQRRPMTQCSMGTHLTHPPPSCNTVTLYTHRTSRERPRPSPCSSGSTATSCTVATSAASPTARAKPTSTRRLRRAGHPHRPRLAAAAGNGRPAAAAACKASYSAWASGGSRRRAPKCWWGGRCDSSVYAATQNSEWASADCKRAGSMPAAAEGGCARLLLRVGSKPAAKFGCARLLLLLLLLLAQLPLPPAELDGSAARWNDWPGAKQATCCSRSASSLVSTRPFS